MLNVPHCHVPTSVAAAESKRDSAMTDERYVETYVLSCGLRGANCDEVEAATGLLHQNASARVNRLASKGILMFEGEVRATRSGRAARVYIHRDCLNS
jgi:hypothetical protein